MAASVPPFPVMPIDTVLYAANDADSTVRLVDGETFGVEIQTKVNFAAASLSPATAATLMTTISIWLMQRAAGGDAFAKKWCDHEQAERKRLRMEGPL